MLNNKKPSEATTLASLRERNQQRIQRTRELQARIAQLSSEVATGNIQSEEGQNEEGVTAPSMH
jgi:hypothetical protein